MQNIKKVVFPQLFWDTLEVHRKHARYQEFRKSIRECILHKALDRNYKNNDDEPFVGASELQGLWHCKIARNPDVILFYKMDGDTLYCAMIGDHSDYGYNGKNRNAGKATGKRINDAITGPHQPLPDWKPLGWKTPQDVVVAGDLQDASVQALDQLLLDLKEESQSLTKLQKCYEDDINDLPECVIYDWWDKIEKAVDKIKNIQLSRISILQEDRDFTPAIRALAPC